MTADQDAEITRLLGQEKSATAGMSLMLKEVREIREENRRLKTEMRALALSLSASHWARADLLATNLTMARSNAENAMLHLRVTDLESELETVKAKATQLSEFFGIYLEPEDRDRHLDAINQQEK